MELRTCPVCGKEFVPPHFNTKMCSEGCVLEKKRQRDRNWRRNHEVYITEYKKEARRREKWIESKPDTIVAIGYAERQIAKSLEQAGRINTEL